MTLNFPPIFQKIYPVFHQLCRVSPNPPLFTAYARSMQLQSPGWVLSVNPLYLTLTLSACNFNHPVGCFPSPEKSRSGAPGVFREAPLGSPARQNGAPGCQKMSKSTLRASKISIFGTSSLSCKHSASHSSANHQASRPASQHAADGSGGRRQRRSLYIRRTS